MLQSFQIPQAAPPSQDNLSYRLTYSSANAQNPKGPQSFYRGIYCHNCCEEGYYSTSCPRQVVSGAQRDANMRAIDELQGGFRQYLCRSGPEVGSLLAPAAPAAVACDGEEREE